MTARASSCAGVTRASVPLQKSLSIILGFAKQRTRNAVACHHCSACAEMKMVGTAQRAPLPTLRRALALLCGALLFSRGFLFGSFFLRGFFRFLRRLFVRLFLRWPFLRRLSRRRPQLLQRQLARSRGVAAAGRCKPEAQFRRLLVL